MSTDGISDSDVCEITSCLQEVSLFLSVQSRTMRRWTNQTVDITLPMVVKESAIVTDRNDLPHWYIQIGVRGRVRSVPQRWAQCLGSFGRRVQLPTNLAGNVVDNCC